MSRDVYRRIGIAVVVVFALLGFFQAWGAVTQAREDYANFRKIVQWVYLKQQQEEAQRQQAQRAVAAARPNPTALPAPTGVPAPVLTSEAAPK